ncbi:hypothetical protein EV649_5034 [Kribbella sp. VKM Ac-2569]|uniref:hypothetical protein n=1 Tax=Kribbella sp. VKM Ac-2569 TaxID=2512220 RepID=UPI0010EB7B3A|nr:hypothetical protein [Kribbella sp. VKM Ac-2569]RZT17488.1 hypothetical protein EV649_5034 [Kribbella sp. VKM Ac-2569]
MYHVVARIAIQNLVQSFLDVDLASVDGRGQIAVRQSLEQRLIGQGELDDKSVDPPFIRFDQSARVMRDELAQHAVGAKNVAKVASPVERMEPRRAHSRRVSDVVQEGRCFDEFSSVAEHGRQLTRASGNALSVRPAPGKLVCEQPTGNRF